MYTLDGTVFEELTVDVKYGKDIGTDDEFFGVKCTINSINY
jgi:hypothetical protein